MAYFELAVAKLAKKDAPMEVITKLIEKAKELDPFVKKMLEKGDKKNVLEKLLNK